MQVQPKQDSILCDIILNREGGANISSSFRCKTKLINQLSTFQPTKSTSNKTDIKSKENQDCNDHGNPPEKDASFKNSIRELNQQILTPNRSKSCNKRTISESSRSKCLSVTVPSTRRTKNNSIRKTEETITGARTATKVELPAVKHPKSNENQTFLNKKGNSIKENVSKKCHSEENSINIKTYSRKPVMKRKTSSDNISFIKSISEFDHKEPANSEDQIKEEIISKKYNPLRETKEAKKAIRRPRKKKIKSTDNTVALNSIDFTQISDTVIVEESSLPVVSKHQTSATKATELLGEIDTIKDLVKNPTICSDTIGLNSKIIDSSFNNNYHSPNETNLVNKQLDIYSKISKECTSTIANKNTIQIRVDYKYATNNYLENLELTKKRKIHHIDSNINIEPVQNNGTKISKQSNKQPENIENNVNTKITSFELNRDSINKSVVQRIKRQLKNKISVETTTSNNNIQRKSDERIPTYLEIYNLMDKTYPKVFCCKKCGGIYTKLDSAIVHYCSAKRNLYR